VKHPIIQSTYNCLRNVPTVARIANFLISRELAYRRWEQECIDRCLSLAGCIQGGGYVITGGLFSGMRWPSAYSVGSEFAPKSLGTYEMEIAPLVEEWISSCRITSVVNIGASEGYYAVGLALRLTAIPVYAYEIQSAAHPRIKALAELNEVSGRIQVRNEFTNEEFLRESFGALPFFVIDIEGCEDSLCDETFARKTRNALLLIEIHDFVGPGTGKHLLGRFSASHSLRMVRYRAHSRGRVARPAGVSPLEWARATDEHRCAAGNYWVMMAPK